jgi:hypothetical protein
MRTPSNNNVKTRFRIFPLSSYRSSNSIFQKNFTSKFFVNSLSFNEITGKIQMYICAHLDITAVDVSRRAGGRRSEGVPHDRTQRDWCRDTLLGILDYASDELCQHLGVFSGVYVSTVRLYARELHRVEGIWTLYSLQTCWLLAYSAVLQLCMATSCSRLFARPVLTSSVELGHVLADIRTSVLLRVHRQGARWNG